MSWHLLGPLKHLVSGFFGERTTRRLALGFAFGCLIGLIPKDNLTVATLTTVLLALRVNAGLGLFTAACVSYLSPQFDPITHRIGHGILTHDAWQATFADWYQLPVVPWFGLHNTVVLGSLVLGLTTFLPVYYLSQPVLSLWATEEAATVSGDRA